MKNTHITSIFCTLVFLLSTQTASAQVEAGCDRAADEATRIETARSILKVNARIEPNGDKNVDHYHTVINYWAEQGSGPDGVGTDGAVYKETTLTNFSRQEMWNYLDIVFNWSSDMELVTLEEIWKTHPDDSMTYMVVNRWFGSTAAGYYEQPGLSIVKFRPGEGCAAYQRDYFSEGDTWWGNEFPQGIVRNNRNAVINQLGLQSKCVDDDGDGYSKYAAAIGCSNVGLDCDDYHADINPGATEIPGNGIDENCNPADNGDWAPGCAYNPNASYDTLALLALLCGLIYARRKWLDRKATTA